MKKFILPLVLLLTIVAVDVTAQTTPKKEFTLSLSENDISLLPGTTQTYEVTINRSKAYNKAKIDLTIGSPLPEGVTIKFEDGNDPMVDRKMIVSTDENVEGFSKTIVLKGRSSRVSKGVMFKLNTSETGITTN
jgi:hypothetical protein